MKPAALVLLGAGATLMELTTALPYFGFLAVLFSFHLPTGQLIFILTLYNLIYMLPLMLLYALYRFRQAQFNQLYEKLRRRMDRVAAYLPAVFAVVAGVGCLVWAWMR